MGKSVAQRQAQYRATRAEAGENGERRLNAWVSTGAKLALERLARREGVSLRVVLERLIVAADDEVLAGLEMDSPEWSAYFANVTP